MPPYRRKGYKRGYGRSRSTSRRRRPMGGSFMKRAKTRAFANLRTGGLIAIERKFSDWSTGSINLTNGGTGVASGAASTFSPALAGPEIYRSAIGTIVSPVGTGAGTVKACNVLGPNDSGSDRDGRQVINDSIHFRGKVEYDGNTNYGLVNPHVVVNIVCVLDTQTNGAGPSGSGVFVNPGDFTANGIDGGSSPFVNLSNSKRFRILKHVRRSVPLVTSGNGTDMRASGGMAFSMDIPLKGMKTNYVSDTQVTTATVASIGDNGVFLFAWIDDVSGRCTFICNGRLRFRG